MFNYQNAIAFNHATWPTAARVVRVVVVAHVVVVVLFAIAVVVVGVVVIVSAGHL